MLSSHRGLCSLSVGCTHHPHTMEPRSETARVRGTCSSLRRRPHVQVLFLFFSSCPACCAPLLKAHAFSPILPRNRGGQDSSPLPRRRRRGGSLPITPTRGDKEETSQDSVSPPETDPAGGASRPAERGKSAATVFGEMPHRSPRLTGGLIGWFQASSLVTQSYAVSTPVFGPMESRLLGTLVKSKSNERGFLGSPLSCGHFLGLQLFNTISWKFLYRLPSRNLRSMRLC